MRKIILPVAVLALALSTAGAMAQTGWCEQYEWGCIKAPPVHAGGLSVGG